MERNRRRIVLLGTCVVMAALSALRAGYAEEALVLHYDFDEGQGRVAHDASGRGNDGRIVGCEFIPRGEGFALRFNGGEDRVDCGDDPALVAESAVTIALSVRPDEVPPGQSTLVAKEGAYYLDFEQRGAYYFSLTGSPRGSSVRSDIIGPMRTWQHVVGTYDGSEMKIYLNGRHTPWPSYKCHTQSISAGGKLALGRIIRVEDGRQRFEGTPFRGMIDDVRVYTRCLSEDQVYDLYIKTLPAQVEVKSYVYYFAKEVVVRCSARGLRRLGEDACVEVSLAKPGATQALVTARASAISKDEPLEVCLDVGDLPAGEYEIRVRALSAGGDLLSPPTTETIVWPERPSWDEAKDVRVLNALVSELLSVEAPGPIEPAYRFVNPRDGWIFVRSSAAVDGGGRLEATLDPPGDPVPTPVLFELSKDEATREAMRRLPKGEYKLMLKSEGAVRLDRLVVRAIPELLFYKVPSLTHCRDYGSYDWNFLAKDVLPNLNAVYGSVGTEEQRRSWRAQGKKSYGGCRPLGMPGFDMEMTPEQGAERYAALFASDPQLDGLMADEINYASGHRVTETTKALEILWPRWEKEFKGRTFDVFTGGGAGHYGPDPVAQRFLSLVTACGGHLLHARYIATQRDEAAARAVMDTRLASLMGSSRRAMPGAEATASIVIGYLSGFPESLDLYPDADFRVHLEMMFRMMATQAEFFGLYGVQTYHNDYADEEIVRWTGRLMRHYCIEGRTDWLTSDPYRLAHIANPGFTEGLKAWTVSMAEDGSVRSDRLPGFVEFRGNISYESDIVSAGIGETLAVMKRSAKAPNAISQTVKDLTPGALYSLRFFAADYGDIRNALSEEKKLAVSVEIENTDLLPEKSFVHVGKSTRSYAVGFPDGAKPGWLNYCRLVFRAKGNEGKLTISDWAAPHEPAGPVGQEILFSFIKIQPCIED